jgi:hypothetical protein
MAKLITILHWLLQIGTLLIFPALAIWASRRGAARLRLATAISLSLIIFFALVTASARFGNRLAPTYGYGYTAARVVVLFGLTLGLPVLATALTVHLRQAAPGWVAYATGVGVAALTWMGAAIGLSWLLPALG